LGLRKLLLHTDTIYTVLVQKVIFVDIIHMTRMPIPGCCLCFWCNRCLARCFKCGCTRVTTDGNW
jgi:hypothetical protein